VSGLSGMTFALLSAWGALTGMDLVTFPQALLSRPLIACAGAGVILGDVATGLRVGVLLELFALDVLPVGASRYPDYGPGAVAAVVLASGGPWVEHLGIAALFALGLAVVGGWSLLWIRQVNGRMIQQAAAGLAAGDPGTIAGLQRRGLAGDLIRSLGLSAAALLLAQALHPVLPGGPRFALVTAAAVGAGVAAAAGGAIRAAGRGARLRWLVVGTGIGLIAAVLT
jgi:mannose/fructose/N-acetylgalactosamine-specific phosphotransferase system component IIC